MMLDEFCNRIGHLRRATVDGKLAPYKPVLLAAVVILIHKRKIVSQRIFLDGGLRSAFEQLLYRLFPEWKPGADIRLPFRHLATDGVWQLVARNGAAALLAQAQSDSSAKAAQILRHVLCAELDAQLFYLLSTRFDARLRIVKVLGDLYFPKERAWDLLSLFFAEDEQVAPRVAEAPAITERAFEEHLERNWRETPFASLGVELATRDRLGLPGRQVLTPVNAIDLLGYAEQTRTWWVFELKRGRPPDAVVGQVSRYLGWVSEERRGRREKAVGVVLAQKADQKLRYAVRANPNLDLWLWDGSFAIHRAA